MKDDFYNDLEPLIKPLVIAMNEVEGIKTIESCGGHISDEREDRLPWIQFSFNDYSAGLRNLTLLNLAARSFGWVVIVEGINHVNQDSKLIPPILKQKSRSVEKGKVMRSHFTLLPICALTGENELRKYLLYPCAIPATIRHEQEQIKRLAKFIEKHKIDTFKFAFWD